MSAFRFLLVPLRSWREIALATYTSWRAHRTTRLAASIAYYSLFAVIPLLTVSVALASIVLDDIDIEEQLNEVLTDMVGGDASEVATAITDSIDVSNYSTGLGLGLIGLGSLLLASSLVFVALQDAFDTIWELPVRAGARYTLRRRGRAFAVVLLSGAVLVANFAVSAIAGLVRRIAPGDYLVFEVLADLLSTLGSWGLAAIVLTLLFRFLTRAPMHWRVAVVGGTITALVMTAGNRAVAEYLSRWGSKSLAGAAGAILVFLFWVYALAQIVLVGAELTRTLELTVGHTLDGDDDPDQIDAA